MATETQRAQRKETTDLFGIRDNDTVLVVIQDRAVLGVLCVLGGLL